MGWNSSFERKYPFTLDEMVWAQIDFENHKVSSINLCLTCSLTGLENSTRPLVFTSASGCRASENFVISS